MPMYVDGKKLIPSPVVSITRDFLRTGDGTIVGRAYRLSVRGTLLPYKGSPDASGVFWTGAGYPPDTTVTASTELRYILAKQAALRDIFSKDGLLLEVQPWDGGPNIKCNAR